MEKELQLSGPIFMEILLDLQLLKKIKHESQFNLEEWLKRRYSDPLTKTM